MARQKGGVAWTSGTTFWWVSNYTTWPRTDGIGPPGSAAWLHLINSSIYILTINVVFCCSLNGSHHRPHANTTQRGISCYDCHAETNVIKPECIKLAHALASRLSFRVQTLIQAAMIVFLTRTVQNSPSSFCQGTIRWKRSLSSSWHRFKILIAFIPKAHCP